MTIPNMTKLLYSSLIVLSLLSSSCEEEDNKGYPKIITFPANGGEKVIKGKEAFSYLLIADGTEEIPSNINNDSIIVQHNWLTAKTKKGSNTLIITAESSDLSHDRTLRIYGYFRNEYANIQIVQNGQ